MKNRNSIEQSRLPRSSVQRRKNFINKQEEREKVVDDIDLLTSRTIESGHEEDLNEAQKILRSVEFKEIKTIEDLRQLTGRLLSLDLRIADLGYTLPILGSNVSLIDFPIAVQEIKRFKETLNAKHRDILSNAEFLKLNYPYDYDLFKKVIDHLISDIKIFEKGNIFARLKYDPINEEGLTNHDIRTKYRKYGIDYDSQAMTDLFDNDVSEELIKSYYDAGFLQPDFYFFVAFDIDLEKFRDFISLFDNDEKIKHRYSISRREVAEAIHLGIDRHFIVSLITGDFIDSNFFLHRESFQSLFESESNKNRFALLKKFLPGKTYQEKNNFLVKAKKNGLTNMDTLIIIRTPELDFSKIESLKKTYPRLSPSRIIDAYFEKSEGHEEDKMDPYLKLMEDFTIIRHNLDDLNISINSNYEEILFYMIDNHISLDELRIFFENIPDLERTLDYFKAINDQLPGVSMAELVPYLKIVHDSKIGSIEGVNPKIKSNHHNILPGWVDSVVFLYESQEISLEKVRLLYEYIPESYRYIDDLKAIIKELGRLDINELEPFLILGNHNWGCSGWGKGIAYMIKNHISIKEVSDLFNGITAYSYLTIFSDLGLIMNKLPGVAISDLVPYFDLIKKYKYSIYNFYSEVSTEISWQDDIVYFIKQNTSVKSIKKYLRISEQNLHDVRLYLENGIRIKEIKRIKKIFTKKIDGTHFYDSIPVDAETIINWLKKGYEHAHLRKILEFTSKNNIDLLLMSSVNIERYFDVYKKKMKFLKLYNHFLAKKRNDPDQKSLDILFWLVEHDVDDERIDFIKKADLSIELLDIIETFDLWEFFPYLEPKFCNYKTFVYALVAWKESGISKEDIEKILSHENFFKFILATQKTGKDLKSYIPYAEFFILEEILRPLELFILFEVSPDRLYKYYGVTRRNIFKQDAGRIIMREYERGKLSANMSAFIEKYNLSFPDRYPMKILERLKNGYESPEEKDKPVAVILITKTDWNSAFNYERIYESLLAGYNVYIYEVHSDVNFTESVQNFGEEMKEKGKQIDLMMIGGHGSKTDIQFSSGNKSEDVNHLDLTDEASLRPLREYFSPDAQIILQSCSTGKGRNSISALIGKALGVDTVHAPKSATNIKEIIFVNKTSKVESVIYNDEEELDSRSR